MTFNPMRAAPVTREEFAEALAVIVAMAPANIERFLIDDQELRKQAERAAPRLDSATKAASKRAKQHIFESSDFHADTCRVCGKYKSYSGHISPEEFIRRGSKR